jgi:hypothetical protein
VITFKAHHIHPQEVGEWGNVAFMLGKETILD